MSPRLSLILVPLCGILVLLSLIVMSVFHRLIRKGDELDADQLRRTRSFATIMLVLIVIALMAVTIYLFVTLRKLTR